MTLAGILDTDDERAGRRLIDQAGTILTGSRGDVPASFVALLLARAAPEDLVRYDARELAALAERAWDSLQDRKSGVPRIRFESPGEAGNAGRLHAVSVIEIVNDDMPFLLDSVMNDLTEQGVDIRLVAHPIFSVERDSFGRLLGFHDTSPLGSAVTRESFIHIHTERIEDAARRAAIIKSLTQVLGEVRVSVKDWRAMTGRIGEVIAKLRANPPPLPPEEVSEAAQFLEWLAAENFTFLGVREYSYREADDVIAPKSETGLGILRNPTVGVLVRDTDVVRATPEIKQFLKEPRALIITKANLRSRVHRRVHIDYIGIKQFDGQGRLAGEIRIAGLFTSTIYTQSITSIPYLRRKADAVMKRVGFNPDSHSGKALVKVLETYPRDELFQIDEDTLFYFALEVLSLDERPRVRVLARRDRFNRFVAVLVFMPRERFDSATRAAIGDYLADIYKGRVSAFFPFFTEGPLVRIHFIIGGLKEDAPQGPDRTALEMAVASIVRTWIDGLGEALALVHVPAKAQALLKRYRDAFPVGYRDAYLPSEAIGDIRMLESLSPTRTLGVDFYSRHDDESSAAGLKIWSRERPIPLSERVPILENMGFKVVDERTYRIELGEPNHNVWLHDMLLERTEGGAVNVEALKTRLEACFLAVMQGRAENDGYNALVLGIGLQWRDVAVLRTISRFLRQIRVAYSQGYMWATLRKHPAITAQLMALFHTRFDPRLDLSMDQRRARENDLAANLEASLHNVESLDEDRILRHFINAIRSGLRTNFYQIEPGGQSRPAIAIKFDSRKLNNLPLPRPLYEIFVYSPRIEAVHLRFGKAARGGIRWSDRPQDFRTEVLSLVKAQQVKNAVIVPVGAKGGFIPKLLPTGGPRDAIQAEAVASYTLFMESLLDVTDNLGPGGIIVPQNVVRYDGDDPYLVVAADKGTATFSDIANTIAIERKFWLGDAFASGGSAGYDHKKIGITARGAWEAVRRHFREIDIDIALTPFTVAGIGDMSGDVFGNGMLLDRTIKLVAAFDHRDIFIDPNPDPLASFAERERLFNLPRSSWQDYDKSRLSPGGGVFSRAAKEIHLSDKAQALLGVAEAKVTPQQVMNAILKLNVDLLWFGGIGTYVRAAHESNDQIGDRTNDTIRITGAELRCKVVGEGANLGMTQQGRIEAAFRGVRLNTDAIDNSAGVNTSDMEVNIKIALSMPVHDGILTLDQRNALLIEMTDDVAKGVLRNNYLQTLALSLTQRRGLEDLGFQQRLMQALESRGLLDRAVEFLPDDMELAERRRRGEPLCRSELAVLLAYAKLSLSSDLLDSRVPDDPYLGRELARYFPKPLLDRFPQAVEQHRLRREIITTQLANSMINRGGPSLIVRIADQTGAAVEGIAAAFAAVRDSYGMSDLNAAIDMLDGKVSGKLQLELYGAVQDLLLDRIVWFVRNADLSGGLAGTVEHYRTGVTAVTAVLEQVLPREATAARSTKIEELKLAGIAGELATAIANLPALTAAPDIIAVADRNGRPIIDVAAAYFSVETLFRLDRIVAAARKIEVTDYFDRLALDRALDSMGSAMRKLTADIIGNGTPAAGIEAWIAPRQSEVDRIRDAVHAIADPGLTLSKLSVAASLLNDLVR